MPEGRLRTQVAPVALVLLLAILLLPPATVGGRVISAGDLPHFSAPFLKKPVGSGPQNPLQFDSA
jgi:hypothetical protein